MDAFEVSEMLHKLLPIPAKRHENLLAFGRNIMTLKDIETTKVLFQVDSHKLLVKMGDIFNSFFFSDDGTILYLISSDAQVAIYDISNLNDIKLNGQYIPDTTVGQVQNLYIFKKDYFIIAYSTGYNSNRRKGPVDYSIIVKIDNTGHVIESLDFFSDINCDDYTDHYFYQGLHYPSDRIYSLEYEPHLKIREIQLKSTKIFKTYIKIRLKSISDYKYYACDFYDKNYKKNLYQFYLIDLENDCKELIYEYDYSKDIPSHYKKKPTIITRQPRYVENDTVYISLYFSSDEKEKENHYDIKVIKINYIEKTSQIILDESFDMPHYLLKVDKEYALIQDVDNYDVLAYKFK